MPEEDQSYAQVAARIAPRSALLSAWPLKGGISAEMTVLEIQHPGGQIQKLVVRRPGASTLARNPRAAEDEFKLLQITQALGIAAPIPIALDTSGAIFPTPYLVTSYIEGRMEFSPAHPEVYAAQMAAHLAQIHRAHGACAELRFLPRQPGDIAALPGRRPVENAPWFAESEIRDSLERAWPRLRRNPPTLLHGDYWPGNILWQGDNLAAVIDWEDACIGEPLSDLAITRLDLLWIIGPQAVLAFTRAYQSRMALDDTCLPDWDLYAALRLARLAGPDLDGWASFFHPFGRRDITPGSIRAHYRDFVVQAFEKQARP